MTKYVKTCEMKYALFNCKSREINLSFATIDLSCFSKNMYLHTNSIIINKARKCDSMPQCAS